MDPLMSPRSPQLNVAVIGAGAIGLEHLASFQQHPHARLAALAETSPERGRVAAEKFGVAELVTDYRVLLDRPDIDIVSIALPNCLHAPVALAALAAGKHVMLEKPMATSATEAAALAAAAVRAGRVLMVGQNNRFAPEVQTARRLIDEGVLGEVYHAKTAWTRRTGIPRIGSWFTQRKFAGGGCVYDVGVHALDRCLFLMGEFDAVSVSGQTYAKFGGRGLGAGNWGRSEVDPHAVFDVDDLAVALIKLRSGRTVLLESSWAAHQPDPDFNGTQLFGTDAGLLFPPLRLFRQGAHGYQTELVECGTPFVSENRMVHFIDVVLGKAEPYIPVAESVAVQRILDAIYESATTGREVRFENAVEASPAIPAS